MVKERKKSAKRKPKAPRRRARAILTDETFLIELSPEIRKEFRAAMLETGTVTLRIKEVGESKLPGAALLKVDPITK